MAVPGTIHFVFNALYTIRRSSSQLGYPDGRGGFECKEFDPSGLPVKVGASE
jgi:hypothetical protein